MVFTLRANQIANANKKNELKTCTALNKLINYYCGMNDSGLKLAMTEQCWVCGNSVFYIYIIYF